MKDEKLEIKDIHQTFWRCRDFELSNLWQRSIFLSAFLVLCFTGYGAVLIKIPDYLEPKNSNSYLFINFISFVISLLGIVFSILWIKMGKGSKAWYENYERAILAMERNEKYSSKPASKIGGFNYKNLPGYEKSKFNNNILSGEAGEYSVSKINIAIGQVFLIVWSLASILHSVLFAFKLKSIGVSIYLSIIALSSGLVILIILLFFMGRSKTLQSTSLRYY